MCDPLRVAESELTTLFASGKSHDADAGRAVFTLDSRELYAESLPPYVPRDPNLPADSVELINALTGIQSILAVLLENERTQDPKGVEMARKWASVHQRLARELERQRHSRPVRRRLTLAAFVKDLGHGLSDAARAGDLSSAELTSWVDTDGDDNIGRLGYLGRRREVMHFRLVNADDHWDEHDLIDMMYLPCAAHYADYVVCEKKTGDYLQRVARDRSGGATVVTSIRDLVSALGE